MSTQQASIRQLFLRLSGYLLSSSVQIALAMLGFLIFALSQPAFAMLMETFVRALEGDLGENIYIVPLYCVGIAVARAIGSYLGSYYLAKVTENTVHALRIDLFNNIIHLPLSYFDNNKSGRLISLFTYNAGLMTSSLTRATTVIFQEGLTVIALLAYLLYANPKLTLVFLVLLPPAALVTRWISKRVRKLGHGIQTIIGEVNHVATESFRSVRAIKSLAAEQVAIQKFADVSNTTRKLGLKLVKANAVYTPLVQVMVICAMALVMYIILLIKSDMDSPSLIAYVTAVGLLPKPIRKLSSVHPQLLQGAVAAEQVFEHIDFDREQNTGEIREGEIQGNIQLQQVYFGYTPDKHVLHDISLDIAPGETIALVGNSGGGKSTLANLIPRFYLPTSGQILLDQRPLDSYENTYLRNNIAIVSQNITLFNGTIKENIGYGVEADNEAIEAAAKLAYADDFICKLPQQYDTPIGENGVMLSGGQRQRIGLAQAFLKNAPILILDEATSALDNESESIVQNALDRLAGDRTTIVIAHRLSTIQNADRILLLKDGWIVEQGKHEELLAQKGHYYQLVNKEFSIESR